MFVGGVGGKLMCGVGLEGTRWDQIRGSVMGPLMKRLRGVVNVAVPPRRKICE